MTNHDEAPNDDLRAIVLETLKLLIDLADTVDEIGSGSWAMPYFVTKRARELIERLEGTE